MRYYSEHDIENMRIGFARAVYPRPELTDENQTETTTTHTTKAQNTTTKFAHHEHNPKLNSFVSSLKSFFQSIFNNIKIFFSFLIK
jgi:uncharacterized FlaG/YvyC family protein